MLRGMGATIEPRGAAREGEGPPVHATSKASLQPMYRPLSERVLGLVFGLSCRMCVAVDELQHAGGRHG